MKRFFQLFLMIALATLITMGIQVGIGWLPASNFWLNYVSFVVIFFILMGILLHSFTIYKKKHKLPAAHNHS